MRNSVTLEVESDDSLIAIDFLVDSIELSKSRLKKLMTAGGIWLCRGDGAPTRLRRAMTDLVPGDRVQVNYDPALLDQAVRRAELTKDQTLYSFWKKPAGMVMQGDGWSDRNSLERQAVLAFNGQRPVWILTHLPGAGRGVVLVAHHQRAMLGLETVQLTGDWQSVLRFRVQGDWRSKPVATASTIDDAAEAVGLSVRSLVVEEYQPRDHASLISLTSNLRDTRQLVEWGAQLGLTFAGAGENLAADDLALALDRDDEAGSEGNYGADRFNLLQVDSVGIAFTCPFTGEWIRADWH